MLCPASQARLPRKVRSPNAAVICRLSKTRPNFVAGVTPPGRKRRSLFVAVVTVAPGHRTDQRGWMTTMSGFEQPSRAESKPLNTACRGLPEITPIKYSTTSLPLPRGLPPFRGGGCLDCVYSDTSDTQINIQAFTGSTTIRAASDDTSPDRSPI